MNDDGIITLSDNLYTTKQVAAAIGRKPGYWSRIKEKYIAKYNLEMVRLGYRCYYKKGPIDAMLKDLLENGDGREEKDYEQIIAKREATLLRKANETLDVEENKNE